MADRTSVPAPNTEPAREATRIIGGLPFTWDDQKQAWALAKNPAGEAAASRGTGAPAGEGVDSGSAPVSDPSSLAGVDADRARGWLTGRLQVQRAHIDRLEAALRVLADAHHRTLTNSRLHDPERIESFVDCPCKTCRDAATVLAAREETT